MLLGGVSFKLGQLGPSSRAVERYSTRVCVEGTVYCTVVCRVHFKVVPKVFESSETEEGETSVPRLCDEFRERSRSLVPWQDNPRKRGSPCEQWADGSV